MQKYIDTARGWDELLQREGSVTSLPAIKVQGLDSANGRAGSYYLSKYALMVHLVTWSL